LEAFRIARAAGVRTVLNPAPARALPDELLGLTDLCVPNETELESLTSHAVTTLDELTHAARDDLVRADAVLAQLETPLEATLEAFRIARAAGVRTVLNP
ncbi:PfkB family carbohydrate kinase, partial [Escherichia coli]|uniref:PfkB family carbohydrate kinase n=1 Tax=Escherichia coli TaxID=562 RepID=UPI003F45ED79